MESESKNIIQMLKNVKQIIDVSKARGCWKDEELKDINITYHNVCEIAKQLQERDERFEEKANQPDAKEVDESVEVEEMEDVD
tara:strand:- start:178 stop:426 length:249 start_codon:yes stop_codon:yes gene_type:complete